MIAARRERVGLNFEISKRSDGVILKGPFSAASSSEHSSFLKEEYEEKRPGVGTQLRCVLLFHIKFVFVARRDRSSINQSNINQSSYEKSTPTEQHMFTSIQCVVRSQKSKRARILRRNEVYLFCVDCITFMIYSYTARWSGYEGSRLSTKTM